MWLWARLHTEQHCEFTGHWRWIVRNSDFEASIINRYRRFISQNVEDRSIHLDLSLSPQIAINSDPLFRDLAECTEINLRTEAH